MRRASGLQRIAAGIALCALACSDPKTQAGELVVALATDMAMPDQVDTAFVQVQVRGQVIIGTPYEVGPTKDRYQVPATLTLASGDDPSQPVTIRVAGIKGGEWRTFREVITTVPADRTALLRMPIQWLCDKSARTVMIPDGAGNTQIRMLSTCDDEEHTCIAGVCRPKLIRSEDLPDYRPEDVFGGGSDPSQGVCFDTIACMDRGRVAEPDENCTVPRPAGERVNFALRVADAGICDSGNIACFVPLDADSVEGWTSIAGSERVQITQGACDKLKSRDASALYVSTQCEPKTAADPPCGAWSSVGSGPDLPGGEPPMAAPKATLVTDLLATNPMAALCCPLMESDGLLYSCLCETKSEATIVSVDPKVGRPTTVGAVNPAPTRDRLRFAATLFENALYWQADQNLVRRTPLPGSSVLAASFPVMNGSVYESTSLVASSDGVFVLASGVSETGPVQMLGIAPSMTVRSFDTGATQPVFQFDHDDAALYLAVDVDEPDGQRTRRTTRVVRMDKQTGALSQVLNDRVVTIEDALRGGGYTGVQVDSGVLFALFEDSRRDDGLTPVQVQRVNLANPADVRVVYETALDRETGQVGLLGAIDGSVLLTRIELANEDGATVVRQASVMVVGGDSDVPRIVGDFARDYPAPDVVSDGDQVYWLNSSGRLFGLPRTALQ